MTPPTLPKEEGPAMPGPQQSAESRLARQVAASGGSILSRSMVDGDVVVVADIPDTAHGLITDLLIAGTIQGRAFISAMADWVIAGLMGDDK